VIIFHSHRKRFRRRVLIGLNKGEALHALARQLFFGQLGELRDRSFEDQLHRASYLRLLMAAIAAWNTVYKEDRKKEMQSVFSMHSFASKFVGIIPTSEQRSHFVLHASSFLL
jgi:TnpA family transposase